MSRYLHGMSDQIADAHQMTQSELAGILADIARLRDDMKPKHVLGHVLPDGRVVLANGDIVDGVRGAPLPGAVAVPPPPRTTGRVKGTILPDGTVMANDKIVDGVRGATDFLAETVAPETLKNMEQDRKLATLSDRGQKLHRVDCDG